MSKQWTAQVIVHIPFRIILSSPGSVWISFPFSQLSVIIEFNNFHFFASDWLPSYLNHRNNTEDLCFILQSWYCLHSIRHLACAHSTSCLYAFNGDLLQNSICVQVAWRNLRCINCPSLIGQADLDTWTFKARCLSETLRLKYPNRSEAGQLDFEILVIDVGDWQESISIDPILISVYYLNRSAAPRTANREAVSLSLKLRPKRWISLDHQNVSLHEWSQMSLVAPGRSIQEWSGFRKDLIQTTTCLKLYLTFFRML